MEEKEKEREFENKVVEVMKKTRDDEKKKAEQLSESNPLELLKKSPKKIVEEVTEETEEVPEEGTEVEEEVPEEGTEETEEVEETEKEVKEDGSEEVDENVNVEEEPEEGEETEEEVDENVNVEEEPEEVKKTIVEEVSKEKVKSSYFVHDNNTDEGDLEDDSISKVFEEVLAATRAFLKNDRLLIKYPNSKDYFLSTVTINKDGFIYLALDNNTKLKLKPNSSLIKGIGVTTKYNKPISETEIHKFLLVSFSKNPKQTKEEIPLDDKKYSKYLSNKMNDDELSVMLDKSSKSSYKKPKGYPTEGLKKLVEEINKPVSKKLSVEDIDKLMESPTERSKPMYPFFGKDRFSKMGRYKRG